MGKLIAGTDHEVVKGVLGIQLRGSIPIETLLGNRTGRLTLRSGGRIVARFGRLCGLSVAAMLFVGNELDVLELEPEIFDGFADQVAVAFADVAELRIGNAHEKDWALRVIVARGLQPGLVGVAS